MIKKTNEERLEKRTRAIGRKIFRAIRNHEPRGIHLQRAQDFVMNLMMKDEDLRYRLLRYVDVYPALSTRGEIARQLEEYLTAPELDSGSPGTRLSALARQVGKHRTATQPLIATASRIGISQMGNRFIAGDTPGEVALRIRKMEKQGFLFSLDLLGEFVVSEKQADAYQRRYLEMIRKFEGALGPHPGRQVAECGPRVNISIKLSSLTSKFDPMDDVGTSRDVRGRLRPLFRAARKGNVFLNIDMEKREFRDLTLRIILELLDEEEFRGFPHIGTVHQAYLRDAESVLEDFLAELRERNQPMTIRLVKGAYWDSEQIWARQRGWSVPVYTSKEDTDACFERCTEILMRNHDLVRTAIASHNVRSIARALALKRHLRVPDSSVEFQMLYGMAGPIMDAMGDMGVPVRVYTPCGELIPGMSYLVRRILENTSNESFLRQRFAEGLPEEELLADPGRPHRTEWMARTNDGKGASS